MRELRGLGRSASILLVIDGRRALISRLEGRGAGWREALSGFRLMLPFLYIFLVSMCRGVCLRNH